MLGSSSKWCVNDAGVDGVDAHLILGCRRTPWHDNDGAPAGAAHRWDCVFDRRNRPLRLTAICRRQSANDISMASHRYKDHPNSG
jgi:hypothetical protein